jgi:hypothetical protein
LYHAGLSQAAFKVRTTLREIPAPAEGEHLSAEFLAINPDGQVPALVQDGAVITETSVINGYLDDAFPDPPPRPQSAIERARMRRWSQIVDEHLFHAIATIGWAFGIGPILRQRGEADSRRRSRASRSIPSGRSGSRLITAFRKQTSTRRGPRSPTGSADGERTGAASLSGGPARRSGPPIDADAHWNMSANLALICLVFFSMKS